MSIQVMLQILIWVYCWRTGSVDYSLELLVFHHCKVMQSHTRSLSILLLTELPRQHCWRQMWPMCWRLLWWPNLWNFEWLQTMSVPTDPPTQPVSGRLVHECLCLLTYSSFPSCTWMRIYMSCIVALICHWTCYIKQGLTTCETCVEGRLMWS